ncbi:MAG: rhomboid family intramembrane serine protease [Bacteroidales bacterium]|nr:rhomboid family intramembrane serine protease [Bacteroidales bacterium]
MDPERSKLIRSFFFPAIFVLLIWLVKALEFILNISFAEYGLSPLQWKGLPGILTMPLIHSGWGHLFANSIPLFLLSALLFHFYREIAWTVLILIYLLSGFWVWFLGEAGSVHIGASGIVYGLAAFLFTSGIIRREIKLMAITLLVTFLYGGLIWGVFPQFFPKERISWEGHLMGLLAGTILAIYFRKQGPQRPSYDWEDDDFDDNDPYGGYHPDDPTIPKPQEPPEIKYYS